MLQSHPFFQHKIPHAIVGSQGSTEAITAGPKALKSSEGTREAKHMVYTNLGDVKLQTVRFQCHADVGLVFIPIILRMNMLDVVTPYLYSPGSQYSHTSARTTSKMMPSCCQEPTQLTLYNSKSLLVECCTSNIAEQIIFCALF